jgi:SAM-dependent methyltransferase
MSATTPSPDPPHAPATLRNREPILAALRRLLPERGLLLEVASGTGEHAAYMAPRLPPGLTWQPSDGDPAALAGIDAHTAPLRAATPAGATVRAALLLDAARPDWPLDRADAVFCCNMLHIAPWAAAEGLLAGAARLLPPGAPLLLYGPFKRQGRHTAPSNADFDRMLRDQDPRWGVRCLDGELAPLARTAGFGAPAVLELPANNLVVVLRRAA